MATWNLVNADDPLLARTAINAADRDILVNVKDYGAVGDGVTNDSAAIEEAFAVNGSIYFPPGTYKYTGSGLDAAEIQVVGAGAGITTIALGPTSYFIDRGSAALDRLEFHDLKVSGGPGAIRLTWDGENVDFTHNVTGCNFDGYTECAISTNASDMPHWRIYNCIFNGADTTDTIGVALSGYTDNSTIDMCTFRRNRIHIKAGLGGNNLYIHRCDLIFFDSDNSGGARIAIWCVPNPVYTNSGQGLVVSQCKLGNEGLVTGDYRIAYADEGSGTYFGDTMPDLGADSAGYITGHRISHNAIINAGAAPAPLVYSTTPIVRELAVTDNFIVGGACTYLLEYRTAPADEDLFDTASVFGPNLTHEAAIGLLGKVSNDAAAGYTQDPAGMFQHPSGIRPAGGGSPAGYRQLLSQLTNAFYTYACSYTSETDALGGTDAIEATFTTTSGSTLYGDLADMTPGVPMWIEFDLKNPDDGNALDSVNVTVINASDGTMHWRREVEVPAVSDGWVSYAFNFVPRTSGNGETPRIYINNFWSEAAKTVQVGRVRVYHGHDRQLGGRRESVTSYTGLYTGLEKLGIITDNSPAGTFPSLNFSSLIAAGGTSDVTTTVTGAVIGDAIALGVSESIMTTYPGIVFQAFVSSADTVTVRACNHSTGAITPGQGNFRIFVLR